MVRKSNTGFTLIELMIVTGIVAVLSAIAYPSFQRAMVVSKRADMMSKLQSMSVRIDSRRLVEGGYNNIALNRIMIENTINSGVMQYPSSNPIYDVSIWDMSTTSGTKITGNTMTTSRWKIKAVPKSTGIMADDGTLSIDFSGIKCRDAACGLDDQWRK